MLILEHSEPAQALSSLSNQDSVVKKLSKTVLDVVLVASYVIGLLSLMPMIVVCSWAKEAWSVQE
ncbi:MAG: hypothetical protein AAGD25_33520 [Cyanobacteria bacterium P01_F01_bin.150]